MDAPATDVLVVLTTLENRDQASTLIRSLVNQRLVACGTVIDGITSVYRWKGSIGEEGETLLLLKTTTARWDDLRQAINTEHPYDVPEVLALPVAAGSASYLNWVRAETE